MSDNERLPLRLVRYDLYRGHPNMNLLPHAEMKSIMSALINDDSDDSWKTCLNYGANAGDKRLHLALRSFLERRTCDDDRGDIINRAAIKDGCQHELFITSSGVSHGLELICATCTQPGDEVWVERPTYFLAPKIFESNGLIVKALPMMSDRIDDHGDNGSIDIDHLVYKVEEEGVKPPKMIYIIPSYHNPTGRTMTWKERERLASFALRHGVILVADEVYHLLDWEMKSQNHFNADVKSRRPCGMVNFNVLLQSESVETTIQHADRIGCCVSVSSFTKIWAPGIRLGWIDAPSFIIQRLKQYGYINSQGGVAPFMGRIMSQAIESNLLDAYLDKLRFEYAERCEIMYNILKEEPRISILSHNSPVKRQGGYFVWVQFPSSIRSEDFLTYAIDNFGVKFMAGGKCDPFGEGNNDYCGRSIRSCARLCFADLDREALASATSTFVQAFRSYCSMTVSN